MSGSGRRQGWPPGRIVRMSLAFSIALVLGIAGVASGQGANPDGPPYTVAQYVEPCPPVDYPNDDCWTNLVVPYGDLLYLSYHTWDSRTYRLVVVDVSDPSAPERLGALDTGRELFTTGVTTDDGYAYVGVSRYRGPFGIGVLDLSDPQSPVPVAFVDLPRRIPSLVLDGSHLFAANGFAGLRIYDVSDRESPAEVAQLSARELFGGGDDVSADAAYVAVEGNVAVVTVEARPLGTTMDFTGLVLVDVSDPASPVVIDRFFEDLGNEIIGGLSVEDGIAYLTTRRSLRVIDLGGPGPPALLGSLPTPDIADHLTGIDFGLGHAFVLSWRRGLRILDVADPAAIDDLGLVPGFYATTGSLASEVEIHEGYAYVSHGKAGVQIVAVDADRDGVPMLADNCPADFNPEQTDSDGNGVGDACDACPAVGFVSPNDGDLDGWDDDCDNCPVAPNPTQGDLDGDGVGDACNEGDDGDGDDHADGLDNCPADPNPDQADRDHDTLGDACDPFPDDENNEHAQLRQDLGETLTAIAILEVELGMCLERPAFEDADADGEDDSTDTCPDTAAGVPVDEDGCSLEQACGAVSLQAPHGWHLCRGFDWRNDEPVRAADCEARPDADGRLYCAPASPAPKKKGCGLGTELAALPPALAWARRRRGRRR